MKKQPDEAITAISKRVAREIIKEAAQKPNKLKSFKKTESLLYKYVDLLNDKENYKSHKTVWKINSALSSLSKNDADLIWMKYFEGLTHESIAEKLNCDVSTISRRKNKLILKLASMLFIDDVVEEIISM